MGILSKLFGKKEDPMEKIFKQLAKIIDDEEYQNSMLNESIAPLIINGEDLDQLPGATGSFGFDKENPIPVNGPVGEIAYLSRLETNQGERIIFHRIGAVENIDVFESVTFSGSSWHIFFVDFYHPRRSRLAPKGFRIAELPKQFSGFNKYCENFPYDFPEKKSEEKESGLSIAFIPLKEILPQIEKKSFQKPLAHKAKIEIVKGMLTSYQT